MIPERRHLSRTLRGTVSADGASDLADERQPATGLWSTFPSPRFHGTGTADLKGRIF